MPTVRERIRIQYKDGSQEIITDVDTWFPTTDNQSMFKVRLTNGDYKYFPHCNVQNFTVSKVEDNEKMDW